jgi:hypothetical protein
VTVAMSDHDYGLLVQAVGWIEQHAGADAPEYPHLRSLSGVVDNIAKRRVRGSSKHGTTASTGGEIVVDLRRSRRDHLASGVVPEARVLGLRTSSHRTHVRDIVP